MATFFISDTHVFHNNILRLGDGRPFEDIDHHDFSIVNNWNHVVGIEDTVVHCGDVALGQWPVGLERLSRCNGYKILVPGNHDRVSSVESEKRRERFLPDYLEVFDEVWDETAQISLQGQMFVVSHYPYHGDHFEKDRHAELRPVDAGVPLIHGHTHQKEQVTRSNRGTVMISVGVDSNNWTPVHEDEILRRLRTKGA